MNFADLTPARAACYARERGLFAPGASLHVHEIGFSEGEGFVNHLYKVWDDSGKALIIKQAKPYLSYWGPREFVPVSVSRSLIEANAIILRTSITPDAILPVVLVDSENNLFVQECWQRPSVRTWWRQGVWLPEFPAQIGKYVARNAFYTSEIFLDIDAHRQLAGAFMNSSMRSLMEGILFSFEDLHPVEGMFDSIEDFRPALFADSSLCCELLALRDVYTKRTECLVHGDLHTSNIMYEDSRMVVFDMEYAHMGAYSTDLGYLLGNFISPYLAMPYRRDLPKDQRVDFGRRVLAAMSTVVDTFLEEFRSLWEAHAKPMYRSAPEYFPYVFSDLVPNVVGLAGVQLLGRVVNPGADQDYDPIRDPEEHEELRHLTLAVGMALVKGHRELRTMKEACALIESVASGFHAAKARKARVLP
ncbi:MAG: phosphotransferase [Propionibacteriaceae bacterium]|nr:phosphotransferase [Propionibacteriaceae bacterium]